MATPQAFEEWFKSLPVTPPQRSLRGPPITEIPMGWPREEPIPPLPSPMLSPVTYQQYNSPPPMGSFLTGPISPPRPVEYTERGSPILTGEQPRVPVLNEPPPQEMVQYLTPPYRPPVESPPPMSPLGYSPYIPSTPGFSPLPGPYYPEGGYLPEVRYNLRARQVYK